MNIKELRKSMDLSQAKFSEQFGIPKRTLQDWESGSRKPPQYVMSLLEYAILGKAVKTGTEPVEMSFSELSEITSDLKKKKSNSMKTAFQAADRLGLAPKFEFTMQEYDPDTDINGFMKSADALGANVKASVTAYISDVSVTDPDVLSKIACAYGLDSAIAIDTSSIIEQMNNSADNTDDQTLEEPTI